MIALIIFALLNIVDLMMTTWALRNGMREANPIMRWAMGIIGVIPALVLIKAVALTVCYLALPSAEWMVWVCVGGYVVLTAWNTREIMRWRRRF